MKVDILGVKIDAVSMDGAVEKVEGWLRGKGKYYIVTPNPEFIVAAQKDLEFREVLNKADLAIPDGVGLKIANRCIEKIIPGVDLMEKLCRMAADQGFTVGFLGGRGEVAVKSVERLRSRYPKLKVKFAGEGGEIDEDGWEVELSDKNQESSDKKLNSKFFIQTSQKPRLAGMKRSGDQTVFLKEKPRTLSPRRFIPNTNLLFVAFGQVKQEKWIARNLPDLPVKVAMGVGGAFDYLSGRIVRAPLWMRNLSLEWLFRLIVQPRRIKRQLALLQFLWLMIGRKLK